MDTLFTAFALLCLSACAVCVYACMRHASDAHDVAHDLRTTRGRLIASEKAFEALDAALTKMGSRLKSLEGKFYAERALVRESRDPLTVDAFSGVNDAEARSTLQGGQACENWLRAQLEGPRSEAAACVCAFCMAQRANRAAEKARILAERNRPQSRG